MHIHRCWSIFVILALVDLFESNPITTEGSLSGPAPTGNTNASTAIGNSTLGFPRGFRLERIPYESSTPFTAEAVFYNIVHVLEQIAPLDYRDLMRLRKFHTAEYPSPVISFVSPYPRGTIVRRDFAVDSLWQAFEMMCQDRTFESSVFTMLMGSVEVGEITFGAFRRDNLEQPTIGNTNRKANLDRVNSLKHSKTMVNAPKTSIEPTNLTDLSVGHFSLRFLHAGLEYSKTDIMLAIIGMLVAAAEPPKDTRIRS